MAESTTAGPDAVGSPNALEDLMRRAQRGDRSSLPELNRFFDEHPEAWRQCGDLGKRTQQAWTAIAVESDLLLSESIRRKLAELERSVAGPRPTPVEALLAERVALTWLGSHLADLVLARAKGAGAPPGVETHLQRVQERSQRMYLQAIKALATVKRLLPAPGVAKPAGKSKPVSANAPHVEDPIFAALAEDLDLAGDTPVPKQATKPRGSKPVPANAPHVEDPIFAVLAEDLDLARGRDTPVPKRATKPRGSKAARPRYRRALATR